MPVILKGRGELRDLLLKINTTSSVSSERLGKLRVADWKVAWLRRVRNERTVRTSQQYERRQHNVYRAREMRNKFGVLRTSFNSGNRSGRIYKLKCGDFDALLLFWCFAP